MHFLSVFSDPDEMPAGVNQAPLRLWNAAFHPIGMLDRCHRIQRVVDQQGWTRNISLVKYVFPDEYGEVIADAVKLRK